MPTVELVVNCPVYESFRVAQVAGLFDLPLEQRASERWQVELPEEDEPWQVGLICGPSGSGKSSVARRWFGEPAAVGGWGAERAVVDGFGELGIREITGLLTAVGLGSPPAWVKPYAALSTGEQFRADVARALAEGEARRVAGEERATVVIDEFTSVVDRPVARALCGALRRAMSRRLVGCRLVAVTCHGDVARWLRPDWVLEMGGGRLSRRRLRRGAIRVALCTAEHSAWALFARHHYLSGGLNPAARAFVGWWGNEPVTFCATLAQMGRPGLWRVSRWVTRPEYQGLGIGTEVLRAVAELHVAEGKRLRITASHPAVVGHCQRSPRWCLTGIRRAQGGGGRGLRGYRGAVGRSVATFEFVGNEQGRGVRANPAPAPGGGRAGERNKGGAVA